MRIFFNTLGGLALILWVAFYAFLSEMGCSWGSQSRCVYPAPWDLQDEEFLYMVFAPGVITVGLFVLGFVFGRRY